MAGGEPTFGARIAALLLGFLFAMLTLSCGQDRFVKHEIADLQRRLEAPGELVIGPGDIHRDDRSVKTQWQVQSPRTPAVYLDWATRHLSGDYQVTNRSDLAMSFAKPTEGDVFYLRLDASQSASGSLVKITLEARPD